MKRTPTLLGKRRGDRVHFTFPAGDRLLEILEVSDGIVESASMS
jgi:transcription elongation GreA/GreB family factor